MGRRAWGAEPVLLERTWLVASRGESRCFRAALAAEKMVLRVRDLGSLQARQWQGAGSSFRSPLRVGEAGGRQREQLRFQSFILLFCCKGEGGIWVVRRRG